MMSLDIIAIISNFAREARIACSFGRQGIANDSDPEIIWKLQFLAINADGELMVTDGGGAKILIFSLEGQFIRRFDYVPMFHRPVGIAVDINGDVVVADECPGPPILVFDAKAEFIRRFGMHRRRGDLSYPAGLTVAHGHVFMCDGATASVQVFRRDGTYVRSIGGRGPRDGQFSFPFGIAVSDSGEIFISDCHRHEIQVCDMNGKFRRKWGARGSNEGQFWDPLGIALDVSQQLLLVADSVNDRIQAFTVDGKFQWQIPIFGPRCICPVAENKFVVGSYSKQQSSECIHVVVV